MMDFPEITKATRSRRNAEDSSPWRCSDPQGTRPILESVCRLRSLLPAHADVSEFEHPLTREELATMTAAFQR